jgi:hypothetical protein
LLVRMKVAGVAEPLVACTLSAPATVLAVKVAVAMPEGLVLTVTVVALLANVPDGPVPGAVKVTATPATGLLSTFVTNADRGLAYESPTVADCGEPAETDTVVCGEVFVSENEVGVAEPVEADTLYGPPTLALAVNVEAVATPNELVTAVVTVVPFANVPEGPVAGAENVTVWDGSGLPYSSTTSTERFVAKAMPAGAD